MCNIQSSGLFYNIPNPIGGESILLYLPPPALASRAHEFLTYLACHSFCSYHPENPPFLTAPTVDDNQTTFQDGILSMLMSAIDRLTSQSEADVKGLFQLISFIVLSS